MKNMDTVAVGSEVFDAEGTSVGFIAVNREDEIVVQLDDYSRVLRLDKRRQRRDLPTIFVPVDAIKQKYGPVLHLEKPQRRNA